VARSPETLGSSCPSRIGDFGGAAHQLAASPGALMERVAVLRCCTGQRPVAISQLASDLRGAEGFAPEARKLPPTRYLAHLPNHQAVTALEGVELPPLGTS
jgi:hypothetical protein